MCKCTPELKTPFCGKPGCEYPPQKPMPADERATLKKAERIAELWCDLYLPYDGRRAEEPIRSLTKEIEQALKEAGGLAREDAARALHLYGQHALSCPAAPGSLQPLDVCQCGLDAAIRASITTDEGNDKHFGEFARLNFPEETR